MKYNSYIVMLLIACTLTLKSVYPIQAASQTETEYKKISALKIKQPPNINGILDDACWENAPKANKFIDERTEKPAKNQSVAWVVYSDIAIYVSLYLYDDMPDKIVARQTKDQTQFQGEDWISVSLDPFHTHQFADRNFFMVNPLGTKFAHLASGRSEKSEWIGQWKAAAQILEDGWAVEMEIPWQMLDYPETTEPISMGLNVDRLQQRTGEHSWWSNLGVRQFKEKDGHWTGVLPPPRKRELKLLPYLMSGVNETETQMPEYTARAGADIRYELTPQLRLVGTANPDFDNIEQAVEGIDFSYGERYVPDRRPFFSEGGNVYQLGSLFHSRRIEDMDGGMKVFGKIRKNTTIGSLGTYHQNNQNLILRASHSPTATSNVSAALLSHNTDDTPVNSVGHVSGRLRYDKFSASSNFTQTWSDGLQGSDGVVRLGYNGSLFYAYSNFFWTDPNFVNALGYQPFKGYRGINFGSTVEHEWRGGFVRNLLFFVHAQRSYTYEGDPFRHTLRIYSRLLTHSDYGVDARWKGVLFRGFTDRLISVSFASRASDRFNTFSIDYDWGHQAGHAIRRISGNLKLRTHGFTAGLTSQIQWHFETKYQQILTVTYDFTPALSLGSRLIWQVDGINIYFALRRSGYAGTDFFIILGDPNALEFKQRFVAKVIRAF